MSTRFCLRSNVRPWLLGLVLLFALGACRKETEVTPEEVERLPQPVATSFYLLNEGNMNMNKASLDFVDAKAGRYRRNIYEQINPEATRGLGDVGNDIQIYGSKVYVVVNVSNKVEVLDVRTGKRLKQLDVTNCRYVTFHAGKAYVSSYNGRVGDANAPAGRIVEVDTTTLTIGRTVMVGRQPEEMAIVGQKLYIANSGGYSPPNYERTVSVIDLASFTEIRRIDVAINLDRLKADQYGDLYVTSRGDYYNIPSKLFVIDTQTDQVKKTFDLAASNLCIDGDVAYLYSVEWSYLSSSNTVTYAMLDVKNEVLLPRQFITDGTDQNIQIPYGIAVDPVSKDVYVTDAKDYVTPGTLYCFDPTGRKKWSMKTGDIPAHFAFLK